MADNMLLLMNILLNFGHQCLEQTCLKIVCASCSGRTYLKLTYPSPSTWTESRVLFHSFYSRLFGSLGFLKFEGFCFIYFM